MKKKRKKAKIISLIFLIVVGFSLILWADAVCDFFKWNFSINTMRVFIGTSLILIIALIIWWKKVVKLTKGQLGG